MRSLLNRSLSRLLGRKRVKKEMLDGILMRLPLRGFPNALEMLGQPLRPAPAHCQPNLRLGIQLFIELGRRQPRISRRHRIVHPKLFGRL